jgi:TrmH family RNA methyltransferase
MRGTRLADWIPAARSALVLGSEAAGLSAAVRDACTGTVTIPATGHIRGTESLNVGAAAAILMARLSGAG